MIIAALLFYRKFSAYLENIGFELILYDKYFANRIKFGKQDRVIFHVDYVMYSHVNPKFIGKLKECMNLNYGKNGEVKAEGGKFHEYPGMNFDFKEKVKSKTNMNYYVERMINDLPTKISNSDTALNPYGKNLFEKGNRRRLSKKETEELHTSV